MQIDCQVVWVLGKLCCSLGSKTRVRLLRRVCPGSTSTYAENTSNITHLLPSSNSIFRIIVLWMLLLAFEIECQNGGVKMQSTRGNPMYALRDVLGKGKGLVAIEKISKGSEFFPKSPSLVPRNGPDSEQLRISICKQVDALSEHQRRAFLSMHNLHAYRNAAEQYLGIVRTNALPIETNGIGGGIFLEACRINHACDNNAQKNWNGNIKRHTVHALRDIYKGEEITIYYLGVHKNREARKRLFRKSSALYVCAVSAPCRYSRARKVIENWMRFTGWTVSSAEAA